MIRRAKILLPKVIPKSLDEVLLYNSGLDSSVVIKDSTTIKDYYNALQRVCNDIIKPALGFNILA